MKKVAVFGNAGGGKSTLSRRLSELTRLPLYPIDSLQFKAGGGLLPREQYLARHARIMSEAHWILDGYGCPETLWPRLAAADTLVYVDLPLRIHFLWVTKRLFKALFVAPEGWPPGSPIWRGTFNAYRVLWLCHKHLTPRYRQHVAEARIHKQVYHLRSAREIRRFLAGISPAQA